MFISSVLQWKFLSAGTTFIYFWQRIKRQAQRRGEFCLL
jgi:hypothetical protein